MSEAEGRQKSSVNLDDVLNQEVKATGAEITEGSHPGVLFGFGQPFKLSSNFGPPRDVFDLRFAMYDRNGVVAEVCILCPVPTGGELHRRSKMYKIAKALANGDASLMKGEDFVSGFKLTSLLGRPAILAVKKNAKDFPQVDSVNPPMAGAKFPTAEECKTLASSPGVPF